MKAVKHFVRFLKPSFKLGGLAVLIGSLLATGCADRTGGFHSFSGSFQPLVEEKDQAYFQSPNGTGLKDFDNNEYSTDGDRRSNHFKQQLLSTTQDDSQKQNNKILAASLQKVEFHRINSKGDITPKGRARFRLNVELLNSAGAKESIEFNAQLKHKSQTTYSLMETSQGRFKVTGTIQDLDEDAKSFGVLRIYEYNDDGSLKAQAIVQLRSYLAAAKVRLPNDAKDSHNIQQQVDTINHSHAWVTNTVVTLGRSFLDYLFIDIDDKADGIETVPHSIAQVKGESLQTTGFVTKDLQVTPVSINKVNLKKAELFGANDDGIRALQVEFEDGTDSQDAIIELGEIGTPNFEKIDPEVRGETPQAIINPDSELEPKTAAVGRPVLNIDSIEQTQSSPTPPLGDIENSEPLKSTKPKTIRFNDQDESSLAPKTSLRPRSHRQNDTYHNVNIEKHQDSAPNRHQPSQLSTPHSEALPNVDETSSPTNTSFAQKFFQFWNGNKGDPSINPEQNQKPKNQGHPRSFIIPQVQGSKKTAGANDTTHTNHESTTSGTDSDNKYSIKTPATEPSFDHSKTDDIKNAVDALVTNVHSEMTEPQTVEEANGNQVENEPLQQTSEPGLVASLRPMVRPKNLDTTTTQKVAGIRYALSPNGFFDIKYDPQNFPRSAKGLKDMERNYQDPSIRKWIKNLLNSKSNNYIGRRVNGFWKYASPFKDLLQTAFEAYDVPVTMAYVTILESSFFINGAYKIELTKLDGTAFGPFQILRDTAQYLNMKTDSNQKSNHYPNSLDERNWLAPSACGAAKHFETSLDYYGHADTTWAILAYHAGDYGVTQQIAKSMNLNSKALWKTLKRYSFTYQEIKVYNKFLQEYEDYADKKIALYFIMQSPLKMGFQPPTKVLRQLPNKHNSKIFPKVKIQDSTCEKALGKYRSQYL